jgi:hypothetical protein
LLQTALLILSLKEETKMTLYDCVEKLPATPVLVVAFAAYLFGYKALGFLWKNKTSIAAASLGLIAVAVTLSTLKIVTIPEDGTSFAGTLPSWESVREKLPTVTWADLTPGRDTKIAFFCLALLASIAGAIGGLCDWYQHCHYYGKETLLRWPFGPMLMFTAIASGIMCAVFISILSRTSG